VIEDACIPVEHLGRYITGVREAAAREGVPAVIFGHAGDGNIHVNLIPRMDEPGWPQAVGRVYDTVSALVFALGGTPSGEHGDGRIRAGLTGRQFGPDLMELFRALRTACDPAGILNPGVKLDPETGPLDGLKAGPSAVEIPEDIARALREIERSGRYAANRLSLAGPS
jgi:FAD/FMN-containing dehydrogenase